MTNFSNGIKKIKSNKVGVNKTPIINFDINGSFKAGNSETNIAGIIRWNSEKKCYEWFNGIGWLLM